MRLALPTKKEFSSGGWTVPSITLAARKLRLHLNGATKDAENPQLLLRDEFKVAREAIKGHAPQRNR
jgi:hypothetical protein